MYGHESTVQMSHLFVIHIIHSSHTLSRMLIKRDLGRRHLTPVLCAQTLTWGTQPCQWSFPLKSNEKAAIRYKIEMQSREKKHQMFSHI